MKVKLGAAQYDVTLAADLNEADAHLSKGDFDVIFVDATLDNCPDAIEAFCTRLKSAPATKTVPLIMLGEPMSEDRILSAFQAGFDEVILRPLSERVLLAQLRALMRRDVGHDANPDAAAFLTDLPGTSQTHRQPARLAVVAKNRAQARDLAIAMTSVKSADSQLHIMAQNHTGILAALRDEPELDAVLLIAEPGQEEAALNLLSDLRSRGAASSAGLILTLDAKQPTYAARAFDLGADNVVSTETGARELVLRINRLALMKQRRDNVRRRVRAGLRMAITDPLTGVHNRRFATKKLAQIAADAGEFAILMLDLDHFKRVNDLYGHGVGDHVLSTIAKVLQSNLREGDLLARIGGEEFLVALPGASAAQAMGTAERLRAIIDRTPIKAPKACGIVNATLSIGLVHSKGTVGSIDTLIAKADEALYRAKSDGRNMVSVSQAA